jgi:hypothetical protein
MARSPNSVQRGRLLAYSPAIQRAQRFGGHSDRVHTADTASHGDHGGKRRLDTGTRRTPNAERRTPNAERRTPNAERRTPNAERDTRHRSFL